MIFLPARTSEITAHNALDRERLRFLHDHRTAGELFAKFLQLLREFVEISRDEVIVDLIEVFEPKRGELIQHCALVGNRIRQNHVEGRKAIGHDEKECIAKIENFAHLAAAHFFYSWQFEITLRRNCHMKRMDVIFDCGKAESFAWLELL